MHRLHPYPDVQVMFRRLLIATLIGLLAALAMGMLFASVSGLWLPGNEEMAMMIGLTGMAAFLAATTHAPIMSTLMICEMTGQYALLPGLLITCVVASVLSRTLRRDSIYRHHVAEHV